MAWTTVRWHSEGLGKRTTAEVLLPVAGRPPFPTFYLLHGFGDDATMWMRHTRSTRRPCVQSCALAAELFFDAEQLVVLRDAVGAAKPGH
jgi:hypothetical protein